MRKIVRKIHDMDREKPPPKRRVPLGPKGEIFRANLKAIRKSQGLTLKALSDRLDSSHPLSHNMISQIEQGARRCDVDDMCALADGLKVSLESLVATDAALRTRDRVSALLEELLNTPLDDEFMEEMKRKENERSGND